MAQIGEAIPITRGAKDYYSFRSQHADDQRHADEVGQASRLHFVHQIRPVNLDGPRADAEIEGDLLVGAARHQAAEHVPFARRQRRQPSFDFGALAVALGLRRPRWRKAASTLAISTSSSNGFSRKSTAPIFMASTASATSPWPVMTITGTAILSSFRRRRRSIPLISGMRTSVMTQLRPRSGSASRKALALA